MSERGFTLLELMIACLLVVGVTAAVAAMAVPFRHAFERTLGGADVAAGSRAALERFLVDLREAGSGATVGHNNSGFADVFAVIVPLQSMVDRRVAAPGRALTVSRIPREAPQGVLSQAASAGTTTLQLDTSARCSQLGAACGFTPDMSAVVFDTSRAARVTIRAISAAGVIETASALPVSFDPGAVLAAVNTTTYGLRDDADGSQRLFALPAEAPNSRYSRTSWTFRCPCSGRQQNRE